VQHAGVGQLFHGPDGPLCARCMERRHGMPLADLLAALDAKLTGE
jgi:hypothetical protein